LFTAILEIKFSANLVFSLTYIVAFKAGFSEVYSTSKDLILTENVELKGISVLMPNFRQLGSVKLSETCLASTFKLDWQK
jgi:hypothetical protein